MGCNEKQETDVSMALSLRASRLSETGVNICTPEPAVTCQWHKPDSSASHASHMAVLPAQLTLGLPGAYREPYKSSEICL